MSFDDDADDEADDAASLFGPPPHPDDRLWRHPSELREPHDLPSRAPLPSSGDPARSAWRPASGWPWGMVAGAVGAVGALIAGLAVGVAGLGEHQGPAPQSDAASPTVGDGSPGTGPGPGVGEGGPGGADGQGDREGQEVLATPDSVELARARDALAPSVVSLDVEPRASGGPPVTSRSGAASRPSAAEAGPAAPDGTGVIVRPDGILLTSSRLVGTTPVVARLNDGRQVGGQVVGADPVTGLAVVDLDGDGFPAAPLGTVTPPEGNPVVTVAAGPEGPAVTGGTVGANERVSDVGSVTMEGVVEVEGASPADVGAPTVDTSGEVVGVTTVVEPGMSYTVPLDVMSKVTDDLLADGQAHHSVLGIDGLDSGRDPHVRQGVLGNAKRGVVVSSVTPDGPSALAGVQQADVILAIDDHPVLTMPDLVRWLRARSPGDAVVLTIERGGETSQVTVDLGALGPS